MVEPAHERVQKRRGRPQRLPEDPFPPHHPEVGVAQRLAWLLATSRLASDPATAGREPFLGTLAEHGIHVDRTRISRWESGLHPVPEQAVLVYETVAGAPRGLFLAVCRGLHRSLGTNLAARRVPAVDDDVELDDLFALIEGGEAQGCHWLALAGDLTRYDRVYLHPHTWLSICRVLLGELSRATGPAYLTRYEAAATLVAHPAAQRYMLRALGEFCTNPAVQVGGAAVSMLAQLPSRAANDLLLRLHRAGDPVLRPGTAGVLAAKAARGQFSDDYLQTLVSSAVEGLRAAVGTPHGVNALELAVRLPGEAFTRVLGSVTDERQRSWLVAARNSHELVPAGTARQHAHDLARLAQQSLGSPLGDEPDLMLQRLVREALFHVTKARRRHAAYVLAASPYRTVLAEQCLDLASGTDEFQAARAWTLLLSLGCGSRRADVLRLALDASRPWTQGRALTQLSRDPQPVTPEEADAIRGQLAGTLHPQVRYAATYALGMAGGDGIRSLLDSPEARLREAAQWWVAVGPGIHEDTWSRDLAEA